MSDKPFMRCSHPPGCDAEATHSASVFLNENHMHVAYYCAAHATPDATSFEDDLREQGDADDTEWERADAFKTPKGAA